MARIRTIKPEFPQSETIGRLSRDARLLFIQLWTVADDAGRFRASSRLLASLLYPYDDDAAQLIEGWLNELEREQCIRRYQAEGAEYADIPNWLKHQKIDKPSQSKLPEFVEPSRKPRERSRKRAEPSATDLGPRIMERDLGKDQGPGAPGGAGPTDEGSQAVEDWNALAGEIGLPLVKTMSAARKSSLRLRLAECGGIEGWRAALGKVRDSPFLRGENRKGWRADFDFMLQQSSFTKLLEGSYDRRNCANGHSTPEKWRHLDDDFGASGEDGKPVSGESRGGVG